MPYLASLSDLGSLDIFTTGSHSFITVFRDLKRRARGHSSRERLKVVKGSRHASFMKGFFLFTNLPRRRRPTRHANFLSSVVFWDLNSSGYQVHGNGIVLGRNYHPIQTITGLNPHKSVDGSHLEKKFQWRLTRYPGSNFFARFFSVLTAWYGPGLNTTFFADPVVSSTLVLVAMELRASLFTAAGVPFSGAFSAFSFRCNSRAVFVCVSASF